MTDDMIKAAAEFGLSEVELHDLARDALDRGLAPEHVAMLHMDVEEITELHNRIAFALRMAGLKGAALDDAIAAAFRDSARAIEQQRAVEWKRGKNVRVGAMTFGELIAGAPVQLGRQSKEMYPLATVRKDISNVGQSWNYLGPIAVVELNLLLKEFPGRFGGTPQHHGVFDPIWI